MKRLILEVVLLVALAAAGPYVWYLHKKVGTDTERVETMTTRGQEAEKKLEEASQALEAAQREVEPLRLQAQQLQALRDSLESGVSLKDLEAVYAKEKALSPERHLGLGVLRLLTTGQADAATVESLKKAMTASDWGSRKQVICAAQNALVFGGQKIEVMVFGGQKIEVMAECKPQVAQPAPAEPAEKKAGG